MASKATALVAGMIDRIEGRPLTTGRPPMPTIRVVETLRFFVREGVQWRELRAAARRACGSTLRRRLDSWSATALLRQVHTALVRMARSGPEVASWEVVVDSCSVRAKHGGELTGPNPTDRGKIGTKYHVVVATDGLPLGAVPSAANVHDTHAALSAPAGLGPGRLRRDRPALRRRRLRQRRQPQALRARGHPASHPRGGPAARLGARFDPLHCRARLCMAVGQQAAGPPPRQAGPCDPGPPERRLHL